VYVEMGFDDGDIVTIDINLADLESEAIFNILVSQIPCTASYRSYRYPAPMAIGLTDTLHAQLHISQMPSIASNRSPR